MNVLMDTQSWLWVFNSPEKLSKRVHSILKDSNNVVYVSAATVWEIVIKCSIGKLKLPQSPLEYVQIRMREEGFTELPITIQHTLKVHDLPHHHRDPFDRILVAQSFCEELPLVTSDDFLTKYKIRRIS